MGTSKAKTPLSNRRLKAVYPHIESLEDFFDIAQLTQDDLNIFGRQVSPAFSDISEISDDGDGQISLNPGLYVSPSLANRIAARKRDVCPPKCSLRSKKSVPREKQRISWCNPVVQDEQSPPEDPMICNGDAIATNPNYLHRARALSKSFFQPIRQCESTGWTSKRPSPRKQRVVLAILIGSIFMAVLAVAARYSLGPECVQQLMYILSWMGEQPHPAWLPSVAFALRRVLQAVVVLGSLVLQLLLIGWLANCGSGSSLEEQPETGGYDDTQIQRGSE